AMGDAQHCALVREVVVRRALPGVLQKMVQEGGVGKDHAGHSQPEDEPNSELELASRGAHAPECGRRKGVLRNTIHRGPRSVAGATERRGSGPRGRASDTGAGGAARPVKGISAPLLRSSMASTIALRISFWSAFHLYRQAGGVDWLGGPTDTEPCITPVQGFRTLSSIPSIKALRNTTPWLNSSA